jgi:ankyrin repeat protein
VNVAEILENAGARLDKTTSTGLSVLSLAAQENKIESMLFFRGKADINATDHKKCTALHWACFKGHEPIVKYLVCENETQLDFQESLGRTALHIAVIYGHERIVRTLLLAGSNRHIKDK